MSKGVAVHAHTIVIAEIGENHVGDMERAEAMIVEAARAGADVVKFQSYRAADVSDNDPEKEWFGKVQLSDADHFRLKAVADKVEVEFLSAPFTVERARFLCERLGLKKIKIASSEMLNFPLLDYVNQHAEAVFLSTGMATLDEAAQAVQHLGKVGALSILHCTTQYPTEPEDANLAVIETLRARFPEHQVGYSDHTIGIRASIAAVAAGAQVIEKHFTLDKTLPGTDHIISADPNELKSMVQEIRAVEVLLGTSSKQPTKGEQAVKKFVRSRFPK